MIALTLLLMGIFLFLTGAFVAQMFGTYHGQTIGDDRTLKGYMYPSYFVNLMYVAAIFVFLTTRNDLSALYKVVATGLIFFGVIAEAYMVFLGGEKPYLYITYGIGPVNYLIRLFYILDLFLAIPSNPAPGIAQVAGKRR